MDCNNTVKQLILAELGRQLFVDENNWGITESIVKRTNTIDEMTEKITYLAEQVSQDVGLEDWRILLYD
jgi:hypothetical protein